MAKEVLAKIKLQLPGGQATPAPPVGTALGPYGINIPAFCKMFNERTKGQEEYVISSLITIYHDHSFEFTLKTPLASMLLKRAAGIAKASSEPNRSKVAKVKRSQIIEIANQKMQDLNAYTIEDAIRIIEGTARNMGIEVEE